MVEQADPCKAHHHIVAVAGLNDIVISDTAAGLRDILHAAAERSLNVVSEGEECVGTKSNIRISIEPCSLFLCGEDCGLLSKECFPLAVSKHVHIVLAHVQIDRVVSVRSADPFFKGKAQNLRRLAEIPVVRFASRKSCAVNSGLLSCADTDCLTAFYITDRVGLCILKGDQSDRHIIAGRLRKLFVLCYDVCEQSIIDDKFISSLLESNAEHLLFLQSGGS